MRKFLLLALLSIVCVRMAQAVLPVHIYTGTFYSDNGVLTYGEMVAPSGASAFGSGFPIAVDYEAKSLPGREFSGWKLINFRGITDISAYEVVRTLAEQDAKLTFIWTPEMQEKLAADYPILELAPCYTWINYNLRYQINHGDGANAIEAGPYVYTNEVTLAEPPEGWTPKGHVFAGWKMSPDDAELLKSGSVMTGETLGVSSNGLYFLYASWSAKSNTVYFRPNGGHGAAWSVKYPAGTPLQLPANAFTRAGYDFCGWALTPDGEMEYEDAALVTLPEDEERLMLYAVWRGQSHQLAFDANGGVGEMEEQTFAADESPTLPACVFTRPGYDFIGWATRKNGAVAYGDAAAATFDYTRFSHTLYAVWEAREHRVTFLGNGGVGAMDDLIYRTGETPRLPRAAFAREGYSFKGWATSASGAVEYAVGDVLNASADCPATTLYAVWAVREGVVRFSANGGFGKMEEQRFVWGEGRALAVNQFTYGAREDYSFLGWSTNPKATAPDYLDGAVVTNLAVDGVVRLYAVWACHLDDFSLAADTTCRLGTEVYLDAEEWSVDETEAAVGTSSLRSGRSQQSLAWSALTNVVEGAGTLTFQWKASEEADFSFQYKTNATSRFPITLPRKPVAGEWTRVELPLSTAGAKEFSWRARYDGAHPDAVMWVDDITWTPSEGTPTEERYAEYEALGPHVYDGTVKTGFAPIVGCSFVVHGETGVGEHTATATLAEGYIWPDGSTASPREFTWRIEKARYDLSDIRLTNATYVVDADKTYAQQIVGAVLAGVQVSYEGNGVSAAGEHVVVAHFAGDENHEPLEDMQAVLTLQLPLEPAPEPLPGPEPDSEPDEGGDEPGGSDPDPGDSDPEPGDGDPDDNPGEEMPRNLYPSGQIGAFTASAAATYIGWLRDADGRLAGTLSVKTGKARPGATSRVTITETLLGQRKRTFRTTVLPAAETVDEYGLTYGALGLDGQFDGYEVIVGRDFTRSTAAADKELVAVMPQGVWTLAFESKKGTSVFSITVSRKGKAKFSGTLEDGLKITASCQGVLGEDGVLAIPFVYAKRSRTIGFVVWIDAEGNAMVTDCSAVDWEQGAIAVYVSPTDRQYALACTLPTGRDYLTTLDGFDLTPSAVPVTLAKRRLTTPRTVGRVRYDRATGDAYVSYSSRQEPANLSALKFTLTAKTGVVKGSCKLYYLDGTRVKTASVTFSGIVVGEEIIGSGQVRNQGSFAFKLK